MQRLLTNRIRGQPLLRFGYFAYLCLIGKPNVMAEEKSSIAAAAGNVMLATLIFCYLFAAAGLLCGFSISAAILPLAFVAAMLCVERKNVRRKKSLIIYCVTLTLIFVSIVVAAVTSDFSYDGNFYHQSTVVYLAKGWNPYHDLEAPQELLLWSVHYAKALEMISATIVTVTGSLESGKAVNLMLILATGLIVYGFWNNDLGRRSKIESAVAATVTACNPVAVCQSLTFYIDYAKYCYLVFSIVWLVRLCRARRNRAEAAIWLLGIVCLAIGTKFNAFFEEGLTLMAAMLWMLCIRDFRNFFRIAAIGLTGLLAGAFIIGYHPYVTNWITVGHPLYPLMGEGSEDIMTGVTPVMFADGSRIVNFFVSLAIPAVPGVESRMGAFGPLFIVMLLLAIVMIARRWRTKSGVISYIAVCCVASCFIFEQTWWGRYVCQVWLLVPLAMYAAVVERPMRTAFRIMAGAAVVTIALCACSTLYSSVRRTLYRNAVCQVLEGREVAAVNLNPAFIRQMKELNVTAVETGSIPFGSTAFYYFGHDGEEKPMLYLSCAQREALVEALKALPFGYNEILNSDLTK